MTHYKRISVYVAVAAALLAPFVTVLPDTTPMSPRSILVAFLLGLGAVAVILRGADDASGPSQPPP